MTFLEFETHVAQALQEAQVDQYELFAQIGANQSIAAHGGAIKKFSMGTSIGVNLKCIINGRVGYASTEKLSAQEAVHLVKTAKENAQFSPKDPDEVLFADTTPIVLTDTPFPFTPSGQMERDVLSMEQAAKAYDPRIDSLSYCQMAQGETKTYIRNADGLKKERKRTVAYAMVGSVAKDETDTYNQYEQGFGSDFSQLDLQKIGKEASKKTLAYLHSTPLQTGSYKALIQNDTALDLLRTFASVFSLENASKGKSLFKGKEGAKVASGCVTLIDAPSHEKSGLTCQFDDQGVPVTEKHLIENGTLTTLLSNLKWAKKENKQSTGNGFKGGYASPVSIAPCNFYIQPGAQSKSDLLTAMESGVLVTSLGGLHAGANVSTGDFSLEAKGFLIQNGQVSTPLKAFTLSGNFYTMLTQITAVANDLYFDIPSTHTAYGTPSILVEGLSFAGQ